MFAFSGIVMNHRQTFSSLDIPRKLLPKGYSYKNWNLDVIKGGLSIGQDSMLLYGKSGIFLVTDSLRLISEVNAGFNSGVDNRAIVSMELFNSKIYAGSLNGLYVSEKDGMFWSKINIPVNNQRITDLLVKEDTLLVLTRDYLLKSANGIEFKTIILPAKGDEDGRTTLFKTLWNLHSGELFGYIGKLFVDLLGIVVIVLSITGLIHFFFPKKLSDDIVDKARIIKKVNLKWHNWLGYVFVVFLLVNTIAGMFLRPPLLIPIANSTMKIIPYTHLDSTNPWQDKLRKLIWDDEQKQYLLSTSDGFFLLNEELNSINEKASIQPPVSVMGCNVLKKVDVNTYLVGSFSGLFSWNIKDGYIYDVGMGQAINFENYSGKPISANMVSGFIQYNESNLWYMDYNNGSTSVFSNIKFPEMPTYLSEKGLISLWNVSLEIHTGRIFESILGPFYILYIPFAGICLIIVLVSGFFLWYWVYRKKKILKTKTPTKLC